MRGPVRPPGCPAAPGALCGGRVLVSGTAGRGPAADGISDADERQRSGEKVTRAAVTAILALIAMLTFAFSFGNIWALGRRLGVSPSIAPLAGPAVDLSVVGLLVAVRSGGRGPWRSSCVDRPVVAVDIQAADPARARGQPQAGDHLAGVMFAEFWMVTHDRDAGGTAYRIGQEGGQ